MSQGFLLYSSDASPGYQRHVLDILCYPRGHIVQFQYEERHVAPTIRRLCDKGRERDLRATLRRMRGLSLYAETAGEQFNLFPTRHVRLLRIHREGTVYYIDARVGGFFNIDLGERPGESLDAFREQLRYEGKPLPMLPPASEERSGRKTSTSADKLVDRERLDASGSRGYFFDLLEIGCGDAGQWKTIRRPESSRPPDRNRIVDWLLRPTFAEVNQRFRRVEEPGSASLETWESVVSVVSAAKSMKRNLFSCIRVFRVRRSGYALWRIGRIPLEPSTDGWSSHYPVPSNARIDLVLLFFRSAAADRSVLPQTLKLTMSTDAFAFASLDEVVVSSRYSEERIEITTKRVLERLAAPMRFMLIPPPVALDSHSHKAGSRRLAGAAGAVDPAEVACSAPILVFIVKVRWLAIAAILGGLTFGPIFLTLGPDTVKDVAAYVQAHYQLGHGFFEWSALHPDRTSVFAKILGTAITLFASYLGWRKLPFGK